MNASMELINKTSTNIFDTHAFVNISLNKGERSK